MKYDIAIGHEGQTTRVFRVEADSITKKVEVFYFQDSTGLVAAVPLEKVLSIVRVEE